MHRLIGHLCSNLMHLINPSLVSILTHSQVLMLEFLLFITTFIVLFKAPAHTNVQVYDFQVPG